MTVLAHNVMKKVRTIFLLRRLAAPAAFLVVAGAVIISTVSVSHVIANMPSFSFGFADIQAVTHFFVAAFAHTDVIVKSALVAGTLFLLLTLKGVVDSIRLSSILQKA